MSAKLSYCLPLLSDLNSSVMRPPRSQKKDSQKHWPVPVSRVTSLEVPGSSGVSTPPTLNAANEQAGVREQKNGLINTENWYHTQQLLRCPTGPWASDSIFRHPRCRLRIHPRVVLGPIDAHGGVVAAPEGAHGRAGNSLH
jgi:hypothetical protein